MKIFNLPLSIVLLLSLMASGCASFRGNEIGDAGSLPDVSKYQNKPSVFVESHFYSGEPGAVRMEIMTVRERINPIVEQTLIDSKLFSKISFDAEQRSKSDYRVIVNIYNHGNRLGAGISGFISGLTLMVIPGVATDQYTLQLRVEDKAGQLVTEVGNADSITTIIGWVALPLAFNTPFRAQEETWRNQINSALIRLIASGKIIYSMLINSDASKRLLMAESSMVVI